jgi:hypothetical protein
MTEKTSRSEPEGRSDREGGDESLHSLAVSTGALLGDDAVADFGDAEDEGGAGDGAKRAGDPYDGEGKPDAGVVVGLEELRDNGDDACSDDHYSALFVSMFRPDCVENIIHRSKGREGRLCCVG